MRCTSIPRIPARQLGLCGLLAALLCAPQAASAQKTYIAVGDSLAFGFKSFNPPSSNYTPVGGTGFTGYAGLYRQTLQTQTGQAYSLVNLGIVGETSGSVLAASLHGGTPNSGLNSNYASTNPSQAALLDSLLTGPGSTVGVITIQVGANDVLEAEEQGQNPALAIAAVQANYNTFLTRIKADEGGAALSNVTIIGYYDPFANLSPTSPYAQLRLLSPGLTASLNSVLLNAATQFGARYVDLSAPFAAHINDYDNYVLANSTQDAITAPPGSPGPYPNDHPTNLGYALIAQQLAAPEPSVWTVLGAAVSGLGLLLLRGRRRRAL